MFNFTTTTVINSDKDYTSGKARWIETTADNSQNIVGSLNVLRVMNFKAPNVTAIYKAVANDPEMAKVTFNFTGITATEGDQFRLSIYVGLRQASQDSRYSNDLILKGKPFTVDFIWKSSPAETVESLVNTINKYMVFVYGSKLLNVSYSGAYLTIEATSEYQIFRKLDIEKLNATDHYYMGSYKTVKTLDSIAKKNSNAEVSATEEGYFVGKEGFGTYSYVLHNLRIPTSANTRAFRVYEDEAPIVGARYNQYTIHYCTNRGQLGLNAVGDTVKSVTTHVFFVNQDVAPSFETALAKIGTVLTVAPGTKTPNPGIVNVETLSQEVTQLKAQVAAKQNKLTAGDGINIAGNTASVKLDGDTLTASANGLKVTDGKFTTTA